MDDDHGGSLAGGDCSGACPFVDSNDPRCGNRFSLGRIEQAFAVCFGAFRGCPMYHRIRGERVAAKTRPAAIVELTIAHDFRPGSPVPLRATGT